MTDANLTTLSIPSFSFPDIQVSENRVERFGHQLFELTASIATTDNADIVICESLIGSDFAQFYIVKSKRVCVSHLERYPVLYTLKPASFKALVVESELRWLNHPLTKLNDLKPSQISKSWQNQFMFKAEDQESGVLGLRTPQIRALHAISAEFSRSSNIEPSTVVLPTGTGKRETMLATSLKRLVAWLSLVLFLRVFYIQLLLRLKGHKTVEDAQKLFEKTNVMISISSI
ncbi:hypothetical protein UA38_16715 [Photobacterium kishitanii]|uniref:Uncharacterized protein n=1 Tax=Photobacterium kishitanii TaxID=318456 RepID=A0AAX0YXY4_9GAMM|nr:hypothetical protein [Photobacterium kishitanii]KJG56007.1 hypothetical protein UA38_16715 [Photobacterium kishitanii]KJG62865.1 hypothetical protein UA42_00110 [Photobacterium kishitanii]KJG64204.1 hypothetical protein UA40_17845 [Photobacterium kishitanii]KJG68770.1 hypothetical protein UA41_15125 [Photobacterium kishitanii]PSX20032.1 hypothetical protein C0W70_08770 [Photobacterium kishitanii]